jgi:hypothetical protein
LHIPCFWEKRNQIWKNIHFFFTTLATWILVWGHLFFNAKISLFGQVFELCCHLMLDPSSDACNQCKIFKLKRIIAFYFRMRIMGVGSVFSFSILFISKFWQNLTKKN